MSSLTTFLATIKKKAAVGLLGATLVAAPGGVALAHGGYHGHHGNNRYSGYHRSDPRNDNDRRSEWQKNCDERQAKADRAIANYKAKAQERFNGLSAYLTNQQSFVTDNNLSIDHYDELNEKATNAQNKASQALTDISSPDINCHHSSRHDKQQIAEAKHDLKKAIRKFEAAVDSLSFVIADQVSVS